MTCSEWRIQLGVLRGGCFLIFTLAGVYRHINMAVCAITMCGGLPASIRQWDKRRQKQACRVDASERQAPPLPRPRAGLSVERFTAFGGGRGAEPSRGTHPHHRAQHPCHTRYLLQMRALKMPNGSAQAADRPKRICLTHFGAFAAPIRERICHRIKSRFPPSHSHAQLIVLTNFPQLYSLCSITTRHMPPGF